MLRAAILMTDVHVDVCYPVSKFYVTVPIKENGTSLFLEIQQAKSFIQITTPDKNDYNWDFFFLIILLFTFTLF